MYGETNSYTWTRMADAYPASEGYSLFKNNQMSSINIDDTIQGYLGDCWVLTSFAAMAEHPQRIWDMFETKTYNSAGLYSLRLYHLGVPMSVVVDDYLPVNSSQQNLYVQTNAEKETWPLLVEKAFAKLNGNFHSIWGGDMRHAGFSLAGTPGDRIIMSDYTAD